MHDVAPPSHPSHLVPGYRLDRYELLYPLAQGGMATVWVARLVGKHGFEKLLAIKTILPQYADDPEFQSMFLDEARLAARIRHPNVAEIMDLGEEQGTLFLVMEWVDGDSLAKLYNAVIRAQKRFPLPLIVRIAADACAGLHAAHELNDSDGNPLVVVHRDVSPQNILVSVGGAAKIIDFGVAKAAQRMTQETSAGLVKGKIQYASPEQATGRAVDRRSDIWAIGTVIYQMITGRLPYDADNQLATLHMLTSGQPPRPLPPTVPRGLQEVVRRALAFRPEDRYATALEMQRALEASVTPTGTHAEVAALVKDLLGDRSDARKRDVQGALAALSSRARIALPASDSSPRNPTAPGVKTPASASGVNFRPQSPPMPKGTLMGMAPPPPPPPPPRVSSPAITGVAPPQMPARPPTFTPPVPQAAPPISQQSAPFALTPQPPPAPAIAPAPWALAEPPAIVPAPPSHSPSGRPVPSVIVAAEPLPAAVVGPRAPSQLRALHIVLGGSAVVVMLGVWSAVAIILMHAPPPSSRTAVAKDPPQAAKPAATAIDTSTQARATASATAAPIVPPAPSAPAASASAPVAAAPVAAPAPTPAPTPDATTPPPVAAVVAAPGPTSTTAAPKGKKKKKYDDGF